MADTTPDQTRERILRAATELFARDGYRATGIRAICEAAGTNVAAVNYHFHSKENLYIEVFHSLFDGLKEPFQSIPNEIHDDTSWRTALSRWVELALRISTSETPPERWISQLMAYERIHPTSALPILLNELFEPFRLSIESILRMGMPPGSTELDLHLASISLTSQCMAYHHREPPWDAVLIPPYVDREEWLMRTTRFIVEGITCRFSFKTKHIKE